MNSFAGAATGISQEAAQPGVTQPRFTYAEKVWSKTSTKSKYRDHGSRQEQVLHALLSAAEPPNRKTAKSNIRTKLSSDFPGEEASESCKKCNIEFKEETKINRYIF